MSKKTLGHYRYARVLLCYNIVQFVDDILKSGQLKQTGATNRESRWYDLNA